MRTQVPFLQFGIERTRPWRRHRRTRSPDRSYPHRHLKSINSDWWNVCRQRTLFQQPLHMGNSGIRCVQFLQCVGVLSASPEQSGCVSQQTDDDHRPDGDNNEYQRQYETGLAWPQIGVLGSNHGRAEKRPVVIAVTL